MSAIIARALGIPVVGRVGGLIEEVEPGEPVIVDADNAQVYVRPGEEVRQTFAHSLKSVRRKQAAFASLRDLPAVTKDGVTMALYLNAGLVMDLGALDETGADGIGLYRTEIPFMVRSAFPNVEEQMQFYAKVLDRAAGRPVVFRTLDVGGDKTLPYLHGPADDNPAMGWRAIRFALDRPAMLRQQLRALIQAASGRELRVMFPMITEVAELEAAKRLLRVELEREKDHGRALPERILTGAMLEVPGACMAASGLAAARGFPFGRQQRFAAVSCSPATAAILVWRIATMPWRRRYWRFCARSCANAKRHDVPLTLLRRDGEPPPRGHGTGGVGISRVLHGVDRHRLREIHAAQPEPCGARGLHVRYRILARSQPSGKASGFLRWITASLSSVSIAITASISTGKALESCQIGRGFC